MQLEFEAGVLLLLVAVVVAMVTKRLHLPYSVGLVSAGIALAAIPYGPHLALTKSLIYIGLLPPLLFEAAYNIHWERLRRNALVVGILVTVGVMLSGAATAAGMHFLAHWQWIAALTFGALIAATDPVSVIAIFHEAKAHGRLLLLIEAESLLNDGTASVAFAVVTAFAVGHQLSSGGVLLMLLESVGGGVACGAAVGAGALLLTGRTEDHLVEVTCTTVAAYGAFLLADAYGMSGVLATITAGLVMRNFERLNGISRRGKEAVTNFWQYAAFIANSMIFLLIGTQQRSQNFASLWIPILIAIGVVLAARALAVYTCSGFFHWSALRVAPHQQHILVWGGLRGAVALALALGLPPQFPMHNAIVTVSFAVVAFSIFVQGLTMAPLLRRTGEIPPKPQPSSEAGATSTH
ncbi:MAG: cation:proton antiporter [Acidobacteriota bacterium]